MALNAGFDLSTAFPRYRPVDRGFSLSPVAILLDRTSNLHIRGSSQPSSPRSKAPHLEMSLWRDCEDCPQSTPPSRSNRRFTPDRRSRRPLQSAVSPSPQRVSHSPGPSLQLARLRISPSPSSPTASELHQCPPRYPKAEVAFVISGGRDLGGEPAAASGRLEKRKSMSEATEFSGFMAVEDDDRVVKQSK